MVQIKNISEVTEPLKEDILKGDVHTIEEMKAWLKPFNHIRHLTSSIIHRKILREFVMSKVSCDGISNKAMIVQIRTGVLSD